VGTHTYIAFVNHAAIYYTVWRMLYYCPWMYERECYCWRYYLLLHPLQLSLLVFTTDNVCMHACMHAMWLALRLNGLFPVVISQILESVATAITTSTRLQTASKFVAQHQHRQQHHIDVLTFILQKVEQVLLLPQLLLLLLLLLLVLFQIEKSIRRALLSGSCDPSGNCWICLPYWTSASSWGSGCTATVVCIVVV
jgi:hypothetical protein